MLKKNDNMKFASSHMWHFCGVRPQGGFPLRYLLMSSAAFCALMMPISASADWQYTRWSMSPAQVIAAAKGSAHAVQGKPGDQVFGADLRAVGAYTAGDYKFESQFFFDVANRLRVVKLTLQDMERCESFLTDMEGLYGRPIEGNRLRGSEVWNDVSKGNIVRATFLAGVPCFVTYRPINNSGASGL
jgi:hypothetical protein